MDRLKQWNGSGRFQTCPWDGVSTAIEKPLRPGWRARKCILPPIAASVTIKGVKKSIMAGNEKTQELRGQEKLFREGGEFGPMPDYGPTGPSRRDLLRLAGFALAGASLAGCQRAPVRYAVPFLVQPEEIVAGRASYYASVCGGCSAGCGLLVKTRDGRPLKLEGNPTHPLSRGGLCAVGQASLLGLYDSQRLQQPQQKSNPVAWSDVDKAVRE